MMRTAALLLLTTSMALATASALAKLPAPSDEAKAKAAEAAAKAAYAGKVAGYQLCKVMDQTAAAYFAAAKKAGKSVPPPVETPACVDPGPFGAAPAAAPAPAPAMSKK